MARKKGTLQQIADAVGGAVQAVAAGVGLTPETAPAAAEPQPKAARKAERKKAVARVGQEQQDATVARRSARRRRQ